MAALYSLIETNSRQIAFITLFLILAWETAAPFFSFFKAKHTARLQHGIKNFFFGFINAVLISTIFIWLWDISSSVSYGLLHMISFSKALNAIIAILLFDLWTYWWHRFNHTVPFLWRFHQVHHSDPTMDVSTAYRFHFGEIIISSILRAGVIIVIGAELWHLALYELLMFPVVQFHHANISLPEKLDKLLRIFIVTPSMHKVHHSKYQPETDSNYTSLFSIWDRLFGSFRVSKNTRNIKFGLEQFSSKDKLSLKELIKTPAKR